MSFLNAPNPLRSGSSGGSTPSGSDSLPSGIIVIWSGTENNIPNGWQLCDGTNGTPNLKDKFVLGAGSTYKVKSGGGSATVTLTEAQIPSHTHTYKYNSLSENCIRTTTTGTNVFSAAVSSTSSNNTGSKGSGEPHENMPPYYALCYIMKL